MRRERRIEDRRDAWGRPRRTRGDDARRLFEAGVGRLPDQHEPHLSAIASSRPRSRCCARTGEEEFGRPVGILADLQGPKLRRRPRSAAMVAVMVKKGATFVLDSPKPRPGNTSSACTCRIRRSSGQLEPGHHASCSTTARCASSSRRPRRSGAADHAGRSSAASSPTARASACQIPNCRSAR
jgi:hypothetical protein